MGLHRGGVIWSCRPIAAVAVATTCFVGVLAIAPPATASIASDQARIVQIQRQIAAEGAKVKSLVSRENAAQARVDTLTRQITTDERRLAADRRAEATARTAVRRVAVNAYMTGGAFDAAALDLFIDTTSVTANASRRHYLGAVGDRLSNAIATLEDAQHKTEGDANKLRTEQAEATRTVSALQKQRRAVNAAIAQERRTLDGVKRDLQGLLLAAMERQAAQTAAERGLAAYPWPRTGRAPVPIPKPSPGVYVNPLRDIAGLNAERIDMGVDYSGYGPIYAIGDGIVLATTIPGWPGGTMIVYQLTDGPANGLVVYAAEDIAPTVHIGDTVDPTTALGVMYPGPDGIETGWGDPAIIGNALAGDLHQFNGANTTAFGADFSQLLHKLGAPAGIPQNFPPTGSLPPNWPQW